MARAHLRKGEPERGRERRGTDATRPCSLRVRPAFPRRPERAGPHVWGCLRCASLRLPPLPRLPGGGPPRPAGRGGQGDQAWACTFKGQRCHALERNKHMPCQTCKTFIFSMLSFLGKKCRLAMCSVLHFSTAQTTALVQNSLYDAACATPSIAATARTPLRRRRQMHRAGRGTPRPGPKQEPATMRRACVPPSYSSQRTVMPALRRAAANRPSPSASVRENVPS